MDTPEWLAQKRADRQSDASTWSCETSRDASDREVHGLTRDVAFNRHSINDGHHLSPFDNGKVQIGTDGIEVVLAQGIDEEAFKRTLSAATRATIGIEIEPYWEPCDDVPLGCEHTAHRIVDTDSHGYSMCDGLVDPLANTGDWEEMLKGGLQTALETQVIVFAVRGVSRTCTHQLVRSRRASFHQQSQRASYMGDAPECRMPESIWVNPVARAAFLGAVLESWNAYRTICDQDISYQDARFVLQEGTDNFILLEYPVREFLNLYAYRGCSMFQWEIVDVMRKCRAALIEAHPWMEPHVKISCERTGPAKIRMNKEEEAQLAKVGMSDWKSENIPTDLGMPQFRSVSIKRGGPDGLAQVGVGEVEHHCTFQGWEDVEGQCDFAWARHEARTFKPKHHRITREKL